MRRHGAAVLGILLGLAATACTDSSTPHPRGPGEGTPAVRAVIETYADDVLLSVYSTGGSGQPGPLVPDVEVRADGTVFLHADHGLGVDTFTLTEAGIARVRDSFAAVSLSQDDYDESDWTDQPLTSVYSTLGGRPEQVSIDGLHDGDVDDDDRDRLLTALGDLEGLAESAAEGTSNEIITRRATYRPPTVAVLLRADDEPAHRAWPLAKPLDRNRVWWTSHSDGCLLVSGKDVVTLEAIVTAQGTDDLVWDTGRPAGSGLPVAVTARVLPVLRDTPAPCTRTAPGTTSVGSFYSVRLGDPAAWRGLRPTADWQTPRPLDLADVVDEVEAALAGVLGADPPQGPLSSYDTEWIVGTADGRRYVEVKGVYPEKYRDDEPDAPTTWQVRVEAGTGTVRALEVEGTPAVIDPVG